MEFKFPDVGEGIHEAQIVKWYPSEGDTIARDEPLVDVETDKAVVSIPSPVAGTVEKILFHEGDMVSVGTVVVTFLGDGPRPEQSKSPGSESSLKTGPEAEREPEASVPRPASSTGSSKGPVLATPAVRRLAREKGIDISQVHGSGPDGRVMVEDLTAGGGTPAKVEEVLRAPSVAGADERRPLAGVRKRIAENMARSWSHAVQVTVFEEARVDRLVAFRRELNERVGQDGPRMSYLPIVIKATAALLRRFPDLNSSLDEETSEIVVRGARHIGVAVDDPGGLMVPVIKDVDALTLREVNQELVRLIGGAREHALGPADLTGSTFTITNYGTIGGLYATPIINYPEVGILGLGPIRRRPIVNENDEIVAAEMLNLSLTFDHRVVDGGYASRFLVAMAQILSDPTTLLLELR